MPKYRKKPVVIEAFKLEKLGQEYPAWLTEARKSGSITMVPTGFVISTLEGEMTAQLGDYIIQGVKGEIYPCKPDIFEATYEEVDDFIPHNID